jgi:hypothetical protein
MGPLCYRRHRFPPEIILHAIWLYLRFTLSYRDVEELLAERGLDISYETVRRWVLKFGPAIARRLRQRRPRPSVQVGSIRPALPQHARCGSQHLQLSTLSHHPIHTADLLGRSYRRVARCRRSGMTLGEPWLYACSIELP